MASLAHGSFSPSSVDRRATPKMGGAAVSGSLDQGAIWKCHEREPRSLLQVTCKGLLDHLYNTRHDLLKLPCRLLRWQNHVGTPHHSTCSQPRNHLRGVCGWLTVARLCPLPASQEASKGFAPKGLLFGGVATTQVNCILPYGAETLTILRRGVSDVRKTHSRPLGSMTKIFNCAVYW